jgi:hypothetical protein
MLPNDYLDSGNGCYMNMAVYEAAGRIHVREPPLDDTAGLRANISAVQINRLRFIVLRALGALGWIHGDDHPLGYGDHLLSVEKRASRRFHDERIRENQVIRKCPNPRLNCQLWKPEGRVLERYRSKGKPYRLGRVSVGAPGYICMVQDKT